MADNIEALQRATHAVLDAVTPVIKEFQESGDREALAACGNTMTMLGATMLRSHIGDEAAAAVFEELATFLRNGDISSLFAGLNSSGEPPVAN